MRIDVFLTLATVLVWLATVAPIYGSPLRKLVLKKLSIKRFCYDVRRRLVESDLRGWLLVNECLLQVASSNQTCLQLAAISEEISGIQTALANELSSFARKLEKAKSSEMDIDSVIDTVDFNGSNESAPTVIEQSTRIEFYNSIRSLIPNLVGISFVNTVVANQINLEAVALLHLAFAREISLRHPQVGLDVASMNDLIISLQLNLQSVPPNEISRDTLQSMVLSMTEFLLTRDLSLAELIRLVAYTLDNAELDIPLVMSIPVLASHYYILTVLRFFAET